MASGRGYGEVINREEETHLGADRYGTERGLSRSSERQDGGDGEPRARDQRADVLPVEEAAKGNF